ncbi:MAG: PQQ-binding-like beta-propeller repeat protein, partial [Planctomycetota bacterium]
IGDTLFTSTYGGGSICFEVKNEGETQTVEKAWKDPAQGYMSTPVVVDRHAYLHLRNQRMACFDIANGKKTWTSTERFGKYMSLVSHGKTILALDERGVLMLIRANPEKLEVTSKREISESPTWAHVAVTDGEIVIRSLKGISVYDWKQPKEKTTVSLKSER